MYGSSLNYWIEKFLRKLAGMADLEDSLKKLDRLMQEEARMANAEVLRLARSIRDGVEIVDGKVKEVGDKVQVVIDGTRTSWRTPSSQLQSFVTYMFSDGIEARVAAKEINDKVSDVGEKIEDLGQDVGDKLQSVDEMVQVVLDGARGLYGRLSNHSNIYTSDGKQARVAAKDIGDKLADVGVKVECVDDKVQVVIDGARAVQSVAKTFQRLFL